MNPEILLLASKEDERVQSASIIKHETFKKHGKNLWDIIMYKSSLRWLRSWNTKNVPSEQPIVHENRSHRSFSHILHNLCDINYTDVSKVSCFTGCKFFNFLIHGNGGIDVYGSFN